MKHKLTIVLIVLALAAFACGQFEIGIEDATPNQPETEPDTTENNETEPSVTPVQDAVRDDEPKEDFSEFWTVVEDYRTEVRFAIPCFWVANIPQPEQDPTGLGSFSVTNFTEDFVTSLGNKRGDMIWILGGMKFDLAYHSRSEMGLSQSANLEEVAYTLVNPDQDHGITYTENVQVQGKQALRVDTWSNYGPGFSDGRFYLLPTDGDTVIMFAIYPGEVADHADIQGILQSFAISSGEEVNFPTHMPANPPQGMAAPCIGVDASALDSAGSAATSFQGTLDCATVTPDAALMWVACNVQDSFRSRNTQPLPGYMGETFKIGYWQSEGVERTRDQAMLEIENNFLPPNPGDMVFTTDEALFPPLFGMPAETMFGPDANIAEVIYSEGWGSFGEGAALLYIAEDQNGDYYFYGMVVAQEHFDK
ncbi:MAG: hypothetical protein PVI99_03495 [Anaerolineales bacterium]|jgi:hypothetical protein